MESVKGYVDGLKTLEVISKNKDNCIKYADFSKFSPCYKFSNENLTGYYDKFHDCIDRGQVLTVCGSGDQVLSSILYGAKSVDCFDSNYLTYYSMMLKIYIIKYLEHRDFCSFYNLDKRKSDKLSIYNSLKIYIDDKNVRAFFDVLFESGLDFSYFFRNEDFSINDIFTCIPYLIRDDFYLLKEKIDDCKINFKCSGLLDVHDVFGGNYDFINFSNIYSYINNKISFYSLIDNSFNNHLNDNGVIIANYSWQKPFENSDVTSCSEMINGHQNGLRPSCLHDGANTVVYKRKKLSI